ncbi:hypothetical protein ACFCXT_01245 [Streptomyces vinaceus]|uniref:hypothetical protein n=1 Tax=Streptomyces vinaceus TaxID=1960 RepID=UPI0035D6642C
MLQLVLQGSYKDSDRQMRSAQGTRTGLSLSCVVLVAAGAAGCTPAPAPYLAVERTEAGGARVLIAHCPGQNVDSVGVSRKDGPPETLEAWVVRGPYKSTGAPASVELFGTPPPGWEVTRTTLAALTGAGKYTATAFGDVGGKSRDSHVTFGGAALERLPAGKVITGFDGDEVVDREKFLKGGAGRCKP